MSDELIYQSIYTGTQIDAAIGKIPVLEANMEEKADKPIIIGSPTANIKLIGEITNYTTIKTFHIEAKLHNMYGKYGSMLSSAYLIVGHHNNNYSIEGNMKILHDLVLNSIATTKIQVTDSGKIYAINQASTRLSAWHIEKVTDNVVIFNNPAIVSTIDGNVIWDSELNKSKIATTDKIDTLLALGTNISVANNINTISKTNNLATLSVSVKKTDGTDITSTQTTIGTIPAGYRPTKSIVVLGAVNSEEWGIKGVAYFFISTDGTVVVKNDNNTSGMKVATLNVSYFAV